MSGIYIHNPFCKKACHYCDFHFSTNLSRKDEMVQAIIREIQLRKDYLPKDTSIQTIYFGGGTPSLLEAIQIQNIMEAVKGNFTLDLMEVTLEANPDDLSEENLISWKELGIDRLSIGIQTFHDPTLKFYNRAHNRTEALLALEKAKNAGFRKFSIDLIYGFPSEDHRIWEEDLAIALSLDPGHISSYALTIEPGTALGHWEKTGKYSPASEDFAAEQFEILMDKLESAGYIQYEISNFAKEGFFAMHNSAYWKGIPYLGIGPSAHSFDGVNRGFNPKNNAKYLHSLQNGKIPFQVELLEGTEQANEYLMTQLRTIWGLDLDYFEKKFEITLFDGRQKEIDMLQKNDLIKIQDGVMYLTRRGKLLADSVASALFS